MMSIVWHQLPCVLGEFGFSGLQHGRQLSDSSQWFLIFHSRKCFELVVVVFHLLLQTWILFSISFDVFTVCRLYIQLPLYYWIPNWCSGIQQYFKNSCVHDGDNGEFFWWNCLREVLNLLKFWRMWFVMLLNCTDLYREACCLTSPQRYTCLLQCCCIALCYLKADVPNKVNFYRR